jgi:hypothetical protein
MATSAIFSAIDEAPLHAVEKLKAISSHAHGRYKPEHSVAETNAVQDVFLPEMFQNNVEKKIAQCRKNTYYKAEHDVWSLNKPENKNKPNQATACSADPVSASRQSDSSSIGFRADVPKNEYITGTRIKTISVVAANPKTSDVAIGTKN